MTTPPEAPGREYPQFETLLRAAEVARVLKISKTAAYRLMSSGELPALKFAGKTVRCRESDLQRFIAGQPGIDGKQA